jgi:hypothetical protein
MSYRIDFYLWGHMRELCQENLQVQGEFVRYIMDSAAVLWNSHESTWKTTCSVLTFKQSHWYLNISSWFMENIKSWNKQHFVENKTEIKQCILKMQQISLLLKYIKRISMGVFFLANACRLKVKMRLLVHSQGRRQYERGNHLRMLCYNLIKHNTVTM